MTIRRLGLSQAQLSVEKHAVFLQLNITSQSHTETVILSVTQTLELNQSSTEQFLSQKICHPNLDMWNGKIS